MSHPRTCVRLAFVAMIVAGVMCVTTAAGALAISDPKETSSDYDMRSVRLSRPASHTLAWTTHTWGRWTRAPLPGWPLTLWIDASGTSAADYRVQIYHDTFSKGTVCEVQKAGGKDIRDGHVRRTDRRSVTCRFSTRGLTLTRLHWRASVTLGINVVDNAPNTGWLKGV